MFHYEEFFYNFFLMNFLKMEKWCKGNPYDSIALTFENF